MRRRRTAVILGTVTAVVAGGLLASGGGPASAAGTGVSVGGFTADNAVILNLGAANNVTYVPTGATSPSSSVQTVTPGCPGSLGTNPQYLVVTPSGGSLGIVDNGIGVKGNKDGSGSPCGKADGTSQYLTLTMGSAFSSTTAKWVRAELDLELKFGASVVLNTFNGNTAVASSTFVPNSGADSGPDSGDGDNYRVIVAPGKLFDKLEIKVAPSTPGGSFDLAGGADGTAAGPLGAALGTHGTVFQMADGSLNCGDSVTKTANGTTTQLTRSTTNADGSSCAAVPYRLSVTSPNNVYFQKSLAGQSGATFTWTMTWSPEAATYPLTKATQIDYGPPTGTLQLQWCAGTTGNPALPAGLDVDPTLAGQQGWCLTSQYSQISGSGQVQVVEVLFGTGDPHTYR